MATKVFISAASNNLLDVVKQLATHPDLDIKRAVKDGLEKASEYGHVEVVKYLLTLSPVDYNYSFRRAAENGHLEIVELFLKDPCVDPSSNENYAIQHSSRNGHVKVVSLLLKDPRVDPTADKNFAVRSASTENHLEVVKLLLSDPRVKFDEVIKEGDKFGRNGDIGLLTKIKAELDEVKPQTQDLKSLLGEDLKTAVAALTSAIDRLNA